MLISYALYTGEGDIPGGATVYYLKDCPRNNMIFNKLRFSHIIKKQLTQNFEKYNNISASKNII